MTKIVTQPTSTAEWQALVKDGQNSLTLNLHEELESYLVFLLMRFTTEPELAASVMANEWLLSQKLNKTARQNQMRDVGDKCLLFSGFFPGRAERKQVKISYFVDLGQTAYLALSDSDQLELAKLFGRLCENFITLVEVLHAIRDIAQNDSNHLSPMQAMELWADTSSQYAFNKLTQDFSQQAVPLAIDEDTSSVN